MPTEIVLAFAPEFIGFTVGEYAVASAITSMVVSHSLQAAAGALAKKPQLKSFEGLAGDRNVSVRAAIAPHQLVYGRTRVGGTIVYAQTTSGPEGANTYMHFLIALAAHELTAIESVLANDKALTLNGSGYVTNAYTNQIDLTPVTVTLDASGRWVNSNPDQTLASAYLYDNETQVDATISGGNTATFGAAYANTEVTIYGRLNVSWMRVKTYLGTSTQTADSDLVSESGGAWTADHRLRGRAYMYVRMRYNAGLFADGVPNFTAIVQGKKVYDPRTGTSYNASNAALCIADYLASPYGLGAAYGTEIDNTALAAAANICEETVARSGGGTELRYEIHGTVDTSQRPREVLGKMLTACAGRAAFSSGKWRIFPAAYTAPAVTISEGDLRGSLRVQTLQSRRDLCNGVKGVYISASSQWQPADFPPVVNSTYLSQDSGERIWRDVELPFTTSPACAQRLAKIELERTRQQLTVTATVSLVGLQVIPGDTIAITNARFGWSAKPFEVLGWRFTVGDDAALAVALELRETASGVYSWSSGEETTVDLAPNTTLPDPFTVAAPVVTVTSAAVVADDGTVAPRMTVAWDAAADAFVRSGGQVRVEWRRSTEGGWNNVGLARGNDRFFTTPPVYPAQYKVRVRFENAIGAYSAWTEVTYVVGGDLTPPGLVTNLAATVAVGAVRLTWTNPVDDDVAYIDLYEYATNDRASATKIARVSAGSEFSRTGLAPNDLRFYWAKAVDTSGNVGAFNAVNGVQPTASVTAPSGLSVSSAAVVAPDGTIQSGMTVLWTASTNAFVTNGGAVRVQWKLSTDTNYGSEATLAGNAARYTTPLLRAGSSYDVRVRFESSQGVVSAWTATASSTAATGDTTAPGAPSGLTATPGLTSVLLQWTNPSDADLSYVEVWEYVSDSRASATKVGQVAGSAFTRTGLASGVTRYYWVRAVDTSGNVGSYNATAGVSATIPTAGSSDVGFNYAGSASKGGPANDSNALGGTAAATVVLNASNGATAFAKFSGTGGTLPSGQVEFNYAGSSSKGGNASNTDSVGAQTASNVATAVVNFNNNNDRNSTTPTAPTVASDGTAVDHTLNADGSANLSFEWSYTVSDVATNAANIDGFIVYVRQSSSSSAYSFGTNVADEQVFYVTRDRRAIVLYGAPADQYYTFGVRAYRVVDTDIDASGAKTSAIVKPGGTGEDPYQPSATVAFSGNITGTINGVSAATVASNAANGQTAFSKFSGVGGTLPSGNVEFNYAASSSKGGNASNTDAVGGQTASNVATAVVNFNANNDRNSTTPTAPTVASDGTAVDHTTNADGSSNISFEWTYTTSDVATNAANIDGFIVYVRQSSSNSAYAFGTNVADEQVFYVTRDRRAIVLYGAPVNAYYTFGVRAYRIVDTDIDASGVKLSGIVKPGGSGEDPYQPSATVAFSGDITGTVDGTAASTVKTAVTNFSANNDRNSTTPTAPTVLGDGTAVDHTANADGSVNISFEWTYTTSDTATAANNIDGFHVYVRQSSSNGAYSFGSNVADEQVWQVTRDRRAIILYGAPANLYYTFGVRAYRAVDSDIDGSGFKTSAIIKPTGTGEDPYQPATSVAFTGDVTGTISNTQASTVATAVTNFNGNNDRNSTTPTAPVVPSDGTAVDHTLNADGSVNLSFEWTYTTSDVASNAANIDGFVVYVRQSTSSSAYSFGTNVADEQTFYVTRDRRAVVLYGAPATLYYTFGVRAYRSVDSDVDASGFKLSAIVKPAGTGEDPYQPSASVAFSGDVTGTINGTSASTVVSNASTGAQDPGTRINNGSTVINASKLEVDGIVAKKFQSATSGFRLEINPAGNTAGKLVTYDGKNNITADIGMVTGTSASGASTFRRAKDANSVSTGYAIDVDYSVHTWIFSGSTYGAHGYGVGIDVKHTGDVAGYFESTDRSGIKVKGSTASGYYDVICEGSGKILAGSTVLPFTGAHEALMTPGAGAEIGDIVVDAEVLAKEGVSNTLFRVELSDTPNQRAVVGVVSSEPRPWSLDTSPYLLRVPAPDPEPVEGDPWPADATTGYVWRDPSYADLMAHEYLLINAVGEGQLNVCGEGGDIAAGDLIVTSSLPGKGMKQADDVVRSYTVARAREAVTFSDPAEVRQIACIYLCG